MPHYFPHIALEVAITCGSVSGTKQIIQFEQPNNFIGVEAKHRGYMAYIYILGLDSDDQLLKLALEKEGVICPEGSDLPRTLAEAPKARVAMSNIAAMNIETTFTSIAFEHLFTPIMVNPPCTHSIN